MLGNDRLDPIFTAVVQATEESVINALVAAETMTGRRAATGPSPCRPTGCGKCSNDTTGWRSRRRATIRSAEAAEAESHADPNHLASL